MKVTRETLKKIIKEEIEKMIKESDPTRWEGERGPVASRFQEPPPPAPQDPYVREKTTDENAIQDLLDKGLRRCEEIKAALMQPPYNKSREAAKGIMLDYEQDFGGQFCW